MKVTYPGFLPEPERFCLFGLSFSSHLLVLMHSLSMMCVGVDPGSDVDHQEVITDNLLVWLLNYVGPTKLVLRTKRGSCSFL